MDFCNKKLQIYVMCDRIFNNSKGCFMTKTELIENLEFITGIEFKTKFERNLKWAQEQDKVIYYDYLSYKRAAGNQGRGCPDQLCYGV